MLKPKNVAVLALAGLSVLAAGLLLGRSLRAPSPEGGEPPPAAEFDAQTLGPYLESYAGLLHAMYADGAALASGLQQAVEAFVAAPSSEGLERCKAAWLKARPHYVQTEVARFSEGPVDGPPGAPERFMNAWPLDESYIDSLINDPARFPRIDRESLREANEKGGETHVATGWHAIEFLLWGPDLEVGPGGGRRPASDFAPGSRRGQYLKVCAEMLAVDLAFLRDQWAPGVKGNYRAWFTAAVFKPTLAKILTGVGTLAFGELRGERLVVPFTLKDREHEHSCFSDTTHLDHRNDMIGVRNVWEGRYRSSDGWNDFTGPGLRDLARRADPAVADEIGRRIESVLDALGDPALDPFEAAILGDDSAPGRVAIQRALDRLAEFNRSFGALAARMGVPVGTSLVRPR